MVASSAVADEANLMSIESTHPMGVAPANEVALLLTSTDDGRAILRFHFVPARRHVG